MLLGSHKKKVEKNILHGDPLTFAYPEIWPFDLEGKILKLISNEIPRIEVLLAKRIMKISYVVEKL